jgi:hypothetical protein
MKWTVLYGSIFYDIASSQLRAQLKFQRNESLYARSPDPSARARGVPERGVWLVRLCIVDVANAIGGVASEE